LKIVSPSTSFYFEEMLHIILLLLHVVISDLNWKHIIQHKKSLLPDTRSEVFTVIKH
jgi:hypothetical protein